MTPAKAIQYLLAIGLTEAEIGAQVGARQSVINRIKHGHLEPRYGVGHALVEMAKRRKSRSRQKAA